MHHQSCKNHNIKHLICICVYMYMYWCIHVHVHVHVCMLITVLVLYFFYNFSFLDSALRLLEKYPRNVSILGHICLSLSLISDAVSFEDSSTESIVKPTCPENFISCYLMALQSITWRGRSVSFIEPVIYSTSFVMQFFPDKVTDSHKKILVSFYLTALDSTSHDTQETVIAAGQGFPTSLPASFYKMLDAEGVHGKLREVLLHYSVMKDSSLAKVLMALMSFIRADSSTASAYIYESTHFMLLFAAQQFSRSFLVQQTIWKLMALLTKHAPQFGAELGPEVIVPAVVTLITEQIENSVSIHPVVVFLINYVLNVHNNTPLVMACFTGQKEFLPTIFKILDDTREVTERSQKEELAVVSDFMIMFCSKIEGYSTVQHILDYQVINHLEKAAVKWPEISCSSLLETLDKFLLQLPPDLSAVPAIFRRFMQDIPPELTAAKIAFFSDNHLEPLTKLLAEPSTYSNMSIREGLYVVIKQLLKLAPEETIEAWLTKEFLEVFVRSFDDDLSRYPSKVQVFSLTAHYISYVIKTEEKMNVLRDSKLHEIAVSKCLKLATTRELRTALLNFINCLLRGYQDVFKDLSVFAESELPQYLVDLAKQYGLGQSSEAGEQYGTLILGLTADKKSSSILHDKGFLETLCTFVSDEYDPAIIRSSIHAVGNIALAGHTVKSEVLSQDFHKVLIAYMEGHVVLGDSNVLVACMRVLHILASADEAKRYFAENGLLDVLVQVMATRNDSTEICWRPLGLMSSIAFMSLLNRELIITNTILKSVQSVLTKSSDAKVISFTALMFLAAIELDSRAAEIRSMGIMDAIEKLLEKKEFVASNNDLKRWGTSLVEKGQLFTLSIDAHQLHDPDEQVLASYLESSISWPKLPKSSDGSSLVDMTKKLSLLPPTGASLSSRTPLAQPLTPEAKVSLSQLGLKPDEPIFHIGRMCGSTHGLCSNCDKDDPSEELVFRPHSLTPWQYQELIDRGWYRRGGVKLFRYRFNHSIDCSDWETRVLISEFNNRKHKSYRKVLRRMPEDRLTIETIPAQFVREAYDLYNSYHLAKHDKPVKSEFSYCEHIVDCPVQYQVVDGFEYGTFHQLYRMDGRLVAVGVIDVVPNGIVSIYMWYDMSKEITKLSFGTYSALKEIEYAQKLSQQNPNIKYYYLQGWNGNNHKLSYKANYEPEEFFSPCNVVDWVQGLDGVAEVQKQIRDSKKSAKGEDIDGNTLVEQSISNEVANVDLTKEKKKELIPGEALPLDRIRYKRENGIDTPNISKTVVCLNNYKYMYLQDMLDHYNIGPTQRKSIEDKVEELVLALSPQLLYNMVIDFLACPKYSN